ncbi:uncharacterized protein BDR25DRAFT_18784 [Lindgomyces ingoldianus]|uniref:Uncharacterized protein n=1 Tax=Lindgomyces ingoldianus TaxID=673940 RepID=A0ACB6R125_9PLEO|nr:uncharacterized protein BDR25DRAFT_18784 [Lindgomyces ingoldianus]KAF2472146.1 hypothetical protein BDR25DRAFT_18784 [Lindgomyces ingoldianus]
MPEEICEQTAEKRSSYYWRISAELAVVLLYLPASCALRTHRIGSVILTTFDFLRPLCLLPRPRRTERAVAPRLEPAIPRHS